MKTFLIWLLSFSSLTFANLPPAKPHLVIAINNTGDMVGTDADTSSYPNSGLNTVPTKDIGTDQDSKQTEVDRNFRGPAPAYPTAPAYAPPARSYTPPSTQ